MKGGKVYDHAGNRIQKFGFHACRHALATWLMQQGSNPMLVKDLLRWSSVKMLDRYAHVVSDEKIAAQHALLQQVLPAPVLVQ